jgi:Sec-independent protein translocase protein TatA
MNGPGILELVVIVFLLWVLLGPQKVMEGARVLGKAYRQFRGHGSNLGSGKVTEKERVRASAERLGIDTSGMDIEEIKLVMVEKLSKE